MTATSHTESTCIQSIPSQALTRGFRLLTLREFQADAGPPSFAWIEQGLLRTPHRVGRHGLFFANTFRPEVMAWLSRELGRPSVRDGSDLAVRNARWPTMAWHREDRTWPDGIQTIEWFVDVVFPEEASWLAFEREWRGRIAGEPGDVDMRIRA